MEHLSQNPQVTSDQHREVTQAEGIMADVRKAQAMQFAKDEKKIAERIEMQARVAGLKEYNSQRQMEYYKKGLTWGLAGFVLGIIGFGFGGSSK